MWPFRLVLLWTTVLLGVPALAGERTPQLSPEEFNLLAERLGESPSFKVRIQAALLLGVAGGEQAQPLLVATLRDDRDNTVRAAAAVALGRQGDPRSYGPLIEALGEGTPFLRTEAGRALLDLAGRSAAGPEQLWEALRSAPVPVRLRGLKILSSFGPRATTVLEGAQRDSSAEVQEAAKQELLNPAVASEARK